jgi:hypothetical protein
MELTFRKLLSVWWLLAWRSLGSVVIGGIIGIVWVLLGNKVTGVGYVSLQVTTGIAGLMWSIIVLQMALCKKYRDFQIVLKPVSAPAVQKWSVLDKALLSGAVIVPMLVVLAIVVANLYAPQSYAAVNKECRQAGFSYWDGKHCAY